MSKKAPPDAKPRFVLLRLDSALHAKATEQAKKEDRSLSNLIRRRLALSLREQPEQKQQSA